MNHLLPRNAWGIAGAAVGAAAGLAALWDLRLGLSVAAGGAWNLANLWCLMQLLDAWLGRASKRRALGWVLVKFPVLYGLVFVLLAQPRVSVVGFGLGFTLVLFLAIAGLAIRTKTLTARP